MRNYDGVIIWPRSDFPTVQVLNALLHNVIDQTLDRCISTSSSTWYMRKTEGLYLHPWRKAIKRCARLTQPFAWHSTTSLPSAIGDRQVFSKTQKYRYTPFCMHACMHAFLQCSKKIVTESFIAIYTYIIYNKQCKACEYAGSVIDTSFHLRKIKTSLRLGSVRLITLLSSAAEGNTEASPNDW